MPATPFMPLWVSDFVGDTLDLDAQEVGAYLLILMAQWTRNGRSLPADKLPRIARCGRNWPKIWAAIGHYFCEDEEGIYSQKGRDVFQNVAAKREVNSRNGARGGMAKALKSKDAGLANASKTLKRNPSIPEPDIEKREAKASPKKGSRLPETWTLPKHLGEWAMDQGMTEQQVRGEADRFRDYWIGKSGRDGSKMDWPATWRNWCRNFLEKQPKLIPNAGAGHDRPSRSATRMDAFLNGATEPPGVDRGPHLYPSQPLLAGR